MQELQYDHTIEQAAKFWYLALLAGGYNPKYQAYQYTWAWLRRNTPRLEVEDLVEDEARRANQWNNSQRVRAAFCQIKEELPQIPEAVLEKICTAFSFILDLYHSAPVPEDDAPIIEAGTGQTPMRREPLQPALLDCPPAGVNVPLSASAASPNAGVLAVPSTAVARTL